MHLGRSIANSSFFVGYDVNEFTGEAASLLGKPTGNSGCRGATTRPPPGPGCPSGPACLVIARCVRKRMVHWQSPEPGVIDGLGLPREPASRRNQPGVRRRRREDPPTTQGKVDEKRLDRVVHR